jgi:hypothetical protein
MALDRTQDLLVAVLKRYRKVFFGILALVAVIIWAKSMEPYDRANFINECFRQHYKISRIYHPYEPLESLKAQCQTLWEMRK